MKRITALLLALVILLSLCGCAKKPKEIRIEYDGETVRDLEFMVGDDDEEDIILRPVFEPDGASGKVEWSSSDRDVVRVKELDDGSCKLKLKDEGEAKITAACGGLSAKVRITVNPAGWTPERSSPMFTPDEFMASDNLKDDYEVCSKYVNAINTHINAARNNTGIVTGTIGLGNSTEVYYSLKNGTFNQFKASHGAVDTVIFPNTAGGEYSDRLPAVIGENDYMIDFECKGSKIVSISISEGDGEDGPLYETAVPDEKIGVQEEDCGLLLSFEKDTLCVEMAGTEDEKPVMTIFLRADITGNGLRVSGVQARLAINQAGYSVMSDNRSEQFTADDAKIICSGNFNGFDYTGEVDPENGNICIICEDYGEYDITLRYTFDSDLKFVDAVCIRHSDGERFALNSDGSAVK